MRVSNSGDRVNKTDFSKPVFLSYTYNSINQLVSVTDPSGTTTYAYDANGNQTQVALENGITTNYTYNNRNRLLSLTNSKSSFTYAYDLAGNRTDVTEVDSSQVFYTYDDLYRLTQEERTNTDTYLITYTYDDVGNRLTKTKTSQDILSTSYNYNQNNQLLSEATGTDTVGYDTTTYTYDSFGNPVATDISTANNYCFTGEQLDSGSNLYYLRARYYDSGTGRFMERDPIEYMGGINLYTYCDNDPVNWVDPEGLVKIPYEDWFPKGKYIFYLVKNDLFHGGRHWNIEIRRGSKLIAKVSEETGEVVWGSAPNRALKYLKKAGKIGGGVGVVLFILDELLNPTELDSAERTNCPNRK